MSIRTVVLNGYKMNYDGNLDYSILSDEVVVYDDTTPDQFLERIQGFDVVVTKEMPVTAEMIAQIPENIHLICEAGTGYNNIDIKAARERDITVCNVAGYSSHRVAHTAIMMILNLSSSIRKQMDMLSKGDYSNFTNCLQVSHTEVNYKTLGVIGPGAIGRQVMNVAVALGMDVLAWDVVDHPDEPGIRYVSMDELLANSDYITLHCPLLDSTRHIINEETIAKMKDGVYIVNCSRGPLIDEKALIAALQSGKVKGAGLDVLEQEPPALDNPLLTMDNVVLTPHMGWQGLETRQRLVGIVKGNIEGFFAGNPVNVVNK